MLAEGAAVHGRHEPGAHGGLDGIGAAGVLARALSSDFEAALTPQPAAFQSLGIDIKAEASSSSGTSARSRPQQEVGGRLRLGLLPEPPQFGAHGGFHAQQGAPLQGVCGHGGGCGQGAQLANRSLVLGILGMEE